MPALSRWRAGPGREGEVQGWCWGGSDAAPGRPATWTIAVTPMRRCRVQGRVAHETVPERRIVAAAANRAEMGPRPPALQSLLIRGHALTRRVREETHEGRAMSGAVALLIAILTGGCDKDRADATGRPAEETPRPVRIVRAEGGRLPRTVVATGALAAEDQVVLNTKVAGRLAELPVDLGSVVRAGDVVAVLDLTDFRLRVEQARTALAQARARLGVPRDGSADVIPPESTALVRQARAVLEQAQRQRERLASLQRDGILSKAELDQA